MGVGAPCGLVVVGDGIVNVGADPGCSQRGRDAFSILGDDHGEVSDVVLAVAPNEPAGVGREELRVPADDLPPPFVPLVETREPEAEDGRLELVEAGVLPSRDLCAVLLRPAVLAQGTDAVVNAE